MLRDNGEESVGAVTYANIRLQERKQVLPYCVIHQSVRTTNKEWERERGAGMKREREVSH